MRHRFALALTFALALSFSPGCSALDQMGAVAGPTGTISSVAPEAMNTAKKALTAAHNLHKSAAVFLTIAAETNLCHATCAVKAKDLLFTSHEYLIAADKLVVLGDAPGIKAKITAATALIAQAQSLVSQR